MPRDRLRIVVIAPYPPPRVRHVYGSGVASYTKNLVEALKNTNPEIEVHIVTEHREGLPELYIDNNVVVHRVYNQGSLYVIQIFKELCRVKPDITHIQHEYFLYGGLLTAMLFPLLVALSRLTSNKVIATIHGVIPLKLLDDAEFRRENGIHGPALVLKLGLLLITKLILLFADKVIVHEPFLKEYLIRYYKEKQQKIVIIPHGVEEAKPLPKEDAKKKLGLNGKTVLLYFGYLAGYKGLKELLDAYKEVARKIPNTVLIVAGGPHPRLIKEKWYRNWLRNLTKKAIDIQREIGSNGRIVFAGYIAEDNIPLYFSATDIVVLPYKAKIAASGREALALAFERCYIMRPVNSREDTYTLVSSIVNAMLHTEACQRRSAKLKRYRLWNNIAKLHIEDYLDSNIKYYNSNRLRTILMIAPEYPPHNIGGGGIVVKNLAEGLASRGYKVIVVTGYYKLKTLFEKPWIRKDGNIYVIWLPLIPTPRKMPYLDTVMPPNIYSAVLLFKILNSMKKINNCIVHLHGYGHLLIEYAALLLKILKKPYIITIHGIPKSPLYLGNKLLKYAFLLYAKLIGRKTIETAMKVTAISKAIAKETITYGARPEQVVVIPNGIAPNYANNVKQGEFRKKYNISPDKKIILCIGRLHPRKGFQYVIVAMPRILKEDANTILVIMGDGPYKKVLEVLAKKLGVKRNILFTGYVDEQTKKEALADTDIVIIPSLTEPFGLVALEAIVMGKPIIVSNVNGLREIVEPLKEILIDPRNTNEIASKVRVLLRDAKLRSEIVAQLRSKLQQFFWDNIIQKYVEVYNEV